MNHELTDKSPHPDDVFTCGGCVHCQPGPNTKNDVLSRVCYRYPPTPMLVGTNAGPAVMSVRAEIRTETPACGEYEEPEDDMPVSPGLTS